MVCAQVYMHYPFEREVPSGLPKTELPLDRPFGELCISHQPCAIAFRVTLSMKACLSLVQARVRKARALQAST